MFECTLTLFIECNYKAILTTVTLELKKNTKCTKITVKFSQSQTVAIELLQNVASELGGVLN